MARPITASRPEPSAGHQEVTPTSVLQRIREREAVSERQPSAPPPRNKPAAPDTGRARERKAKADEYEVDDVVIGDTIDDNLEICDDPQVGASRDEYAAHADESAPAELSGFRSTIVHDSDDEYGSYDGSFVEEGDTNEHPYDGGAREFDDADEVLDDDLDVTPVRQDSNFSRLSAQSWLTVDSAEELEDVQRDEVIAAAAAAKAATDAEAEGATTARHSGPRSSSTSSHLAATVIGDALAGEAAAREAAATVAQIGPEGQLVDVAELLDSRTSMEEMTVLECAVQLLSGMPAYKKKAFRRFGARKVWLSPDCERLCWTSKKDGVESDSIRLSRVARMRCVDREVSIDVLEGNRIGLLFANAGEANMWTRCLSCLIPLQAQVRAPPNVVLSDRDREDYNLVDDMFNGRSLATHGSVNSYVVLGSVHGHNSAGRLALSRADKTFVGIRYIPPKLTSFLLRSPEEIAVLKRLDHPNILSYQECLADPVRDGNYVVFEHSPRGVVANTTGLVGMTPATERSARLIVRDLISALQYLHGLRIAHADVRPDNLLRAANGSVRLNAIGCITQDFTEIRDMASLVRARLGDASCAFLAPELCWFGPAPDIPHKSYAMDVWAVGAILYFLLYGRVPFMGETVEEMQHNICTAKLKFPRMPETSRKVRNLLKGVLGEKNPRTRIPLSELKLHPWFLEDLTPEEAVHIQRGPPNVRLVVSAEEVGSAIGQAKVRPAQMGRA